MRLIKTTCTECQVVQRAKFACVLILLRVALCCFDNISLTIILDGDPMANPHGRDSGTSRTSASSPTPQQSNVRQGYSVYLKVLSPSNKKDFSMFTLRNVNPDELSTLDELKEEVFVQCGEGSQLPQTLEFKMGYFHRSQKLWTNNKHDLNDAWDIIRSNFCFPLIE